MVPVILQARVGLRISHGQSRYFDLPPSLGLAQAQPAGIYSVFSTARGRSASFSYSSIVQFLIWLG